MDFKADCDFFNLVFKFKELLEEFNKIHNLSNYKDINKVALDSINSLKILDFYPKNCIDIGSGSGIPAIFLSFILKNTNFYLFEPNNKKASFLTYVKINLDLKNVFIYKNKIEEEKNLKADLITSRAVMKTKELIKISKNVIKNDTKMLLFKGSSYKDEVDGLNYSVLNSANRNYLLIKDLLCLEKY